MLRKTIKELGLHSLIYMIGGVASSLASILLLPVYTRFLTTADYGILEVLDSIRYLVVIILLAGFIPAMAKFYKEADSPRKQQEVVGTAFWFILSFSLVGTCIFFLFDTPLAAKLLGSAEFVVFIDLGILLLLTQTIFTTGENFLNIQKMSKVFLLASLAKLSINITSVLYFIVVLKLGARGMLYGELLSIACVGVFLVGYLIKASRLRFSGELLIRMLKFGLPFIPTLLSAAIMHRADRYLLQRFCSLSDVGIYGLGYKFPFMLNFLILQSFGRIWNASMMYDVAKQDDAPRIYAKIATYFLTVYVVCQYVLVVMASSVIRVLAAPDYFNAWIVLQIVGLGMCFYSLHNFFTIGAFIKNKTWYLPGSYIVAASINIALNWHFLPKYGYIVAAWSTVVTYLVFSVLGYFLFRNVYAIPFEFRRIAFLLGLAIVLALINNAVQIDRIFVEGLKQMVFALFLPSILLLGPYLNKDEKESLHDELEKIHPTLARCYAWMQYRAQSLFPL